MSINFIVNNNIYEIGSSNFLHSFFSTISYHLENNAWGSKYPYLMKDLYNNKYKWKDYAKILKEIDEIKEKLKYYKPSQLIWDIENISQKPPWGNNICKKITNLANYFYTSDGNDLFKVLAKALSQSKKDKIDLKIG